MECTKWKVRCSGNEIAPLCDVIVEGSGACIASLNDGWDNPTIKANANLIAKSPRMYEWIKELPLHISCVYLDENDPTIPTFTIDTEYLQLSKEIIAEGR